MDTPESNLKSRILDEIAWRFRVLQKFEREKNRMFEAGFCQREARQYVDDVFRIPEILISGFNPSFHAAGTAYWDRVFGYVQRLLYLKNLGGVSEKLELVECLRPAEWPSGDFKGIYDHTGRLRVLARLSDRNDRMDENFQYVCLGKECPHTVRRGEPHYPYWCEQCEPHDAGKFELEGVPFSAGMTPSLMTSLTGKGSKVRAVGTPSMPYDPLSGHLWLPNYFRSGGRQNVWDDLRRKKYVRHLPTDPLQQLLDARKIGIPRMMGHRRHFGNYWLLQNMDKFQAIFVHDLLVYEQQHRTEGSSMGLASYLDDKFFGPSPEIQVPPLFPDGISPDDPTTLYASPGDLTTQYDQMILDRADLQLTPVARRAAGKCLYSSYTPRESETFVMLMIFLGLQADPEARSAISLLDLVQLGVEGRFSRFGWDPDFELSAEYLQLAVLRLANLMRDHHLITPTYESGGTTAFISQVHQEVENLIETHFPKGPSSKRRNVEPEPELVLPFSDDEEGDLPDFHEEFGDY